MYCFGALGPFLATLTCNAFYYGSKGNRKLLHMLRFRNIPSFVLLIAGSPLAFFLIGLFVYPLLAGHWYSFADTRQQFQLSTPATYLTWILPFITYAILEEFGWRAFLLPHLQQHYSAGIATLYLTLIWGCWHLPFFLWRFQFSPFMVFGFFFSLLVGALILTTLFNASRGNLVPVILFHLFNNLTTALDKQYTVSITSTCFVLLAIYLVRKYKHQELGPGKRVTFQPLP